MTESYCEKIKSLSKKSELKRSNASAYNNVLRKRTVSENEIIFVDDETNRNNQISIDNEDENNICVKLRIDSKRSINNNDNNSEDKVGVLDLVVTAIYNYSPNNEDELKLSSGDKIRVLSNDYRDSGTEGWWVGLRESRIGVFPMNYVKSESDWCLVLKELNEENCEISLSKDIFADAPNNITNIDNTGRAMCCTSDGVRVISSLEISKLECLGSGAFGVVYHGKWHNEEVAVKTFSMFTNEMHIYQEAGYLSCLLHHNIVRLFGVSIINNNMFNQVALIMEYARGGCLHNFLHFGHSIKLSPHTLLLMAIQVASGMKYLHNEVGICHRDLKSSNVLIKESIPHNVTDVQVADFTLLITDFGMARKTAELVSQQSKFGTLAYAAPEVCKQQGGFTVKSDVWSYGVLLWELLTIEIPYKDFEQPYLLYKIAIKNQTLYTPSGIPCVLANLLTRCWNKIQESRPDFIEILELLNCAIKCKFMEMSANDFFKMQKLWRDEIILHEKCNNESMSNLEFEHDEFLEQQKLILEANHELQKREEDIVRREAVCNETMGRVNQFNLLLSTFLRNEVSRNSSNDYSSQLTPVPPPRKLPFVDRLKFWGHTSSLNNSVYNSTMIDVANTEGNLNILEILGSKHCGNSFFNELEKFKKDTHYDSKDTANEKVNEVDLSVSSSVPNLSKLFKGNSSVFNTSILKRCLTHDGEEQIKTSKEDKFGSKRYGNSCFYDLETIIKDTHYDSKDTPNNTYSVINEVDLAVSLSAPNLFKPCERNSSVSGIPYLKRCITHDEEAQTKPRSITNQQFTKSEFYLHDKSNSTKKLFKRLFEKRLIKQRKSKMHKSSEEVSGWSSLSNSQNSLKETPRSANSVFKKFCKK